MFLGLTVPALIFALVTKFNNGIAMIGGKGIIVVASGSMSEKNPANGYILSNNLTNQFNTYDIIVLEDVKNKELELYDVIAFIDDKGTNIIHRIVGFTDDGKFITRGDSNNADDTYRPSKSDVLGRYVGTRMQYIGVFVMFFQSYSGMITLVAIIYCLIMIDRFTDKIHDAQERRLELLSSAINFKDELECEDLASEMTQKIYFKGFEYIFNDEGFVDKREISDEELKLKSEGCMIKETSNASGVITSEDIQIPTAELEDGDGEYDEEEKDDDKEEKES